MNDKGFGDYSDGFSPNDSSNPFSEKSPGCTVPDDLSRELGDPEEALFAAALFYRENNSCPTTATAKTSARSEKSNFISVGSRDAIYALGEPYDTTMDSFLDATMPRETP